MNEITMAARFDQAASSLGRIGAVLIRLPMPFKSHTHEIRLRINQPVVLSQAQCDIFVSKEGTPCFAHRAGLLDAGRTDLEDAFRLICNSSVYSHQQEIRNGFVTLTGGHRAGICGTAVVQEDRVANLRDISSINLRVAQEIPGAADEVAAVAVSGGEVSGMLVVGPPGCGKTTVLRDLARQLSSGLRGGRNFRVAVVDERGELAAVCCGCPQNDLGPCCDVLDGYPKGEGIRQAVRCMAPDVVMCDEIGGADDAKAVIEGLNAGVAVIASAHAASLSELRSRPYLRALLDTGAFRKIVLLAGRGTPGKLAAIYEEEEWNGSEDRRAADSPVRLHGGGADEIRGAV